MGSIVDQQANINRTQKRVFTLLTQCIKDIDKTVTASGLKMREVGVGVEKSQTGPVSYILGLKLYV